MDDFRNFEEKELQSKLDQAKKENDLEKRAKMEHEAYDRYFSSLDLSDPDRQGWMAEQQFMREERLQREEGLQKVNDHQKTEKEIIEKTLKEKEEAEKAFLEKGVPGTPDLEDKGYTNHEQILETVGQIGTIGGSFQEKEKMIKETGNILDGKRSSDFEKKMTGAMVRQIKDTVHGFVAEGEKAMKNIGLLPKETKDKGSQEDDKQGRILKMREAREQAKEKEKSGRER